MNGYQQKVHEYLEGKPNALLSEMTDDIGPVPFENLTAMRAAGMIDYRVVIIDGAADVEIKEVGNA